jgi:hypothetical protein
VDPHSIPLTRRYLFHKPLESILLYSNESLRCWIASVKEAELTAEQRLKIYSRQRRNTLHHFFGMTQAKHCMPQETSKESILFAPPFTSAYYQRQPKDQKRRVRKLKLERQGLPKRQGKAPIEVRAKKRTCGPVKPKSRSIYQQKITLEAYGLKV